MIASFLSYHDFSVELPRKLVHLHENDKDSAIHAIESGHLLN